MERCLSEIFGLETIGYKSITKLQSRHRVEPAAVQPVVIRTAHWAGNLEK